MFNSKARHNKALEVIGNSGRDKRGCQIGSAQRHNTNTHSLLAPLSSFRWEWCQLSPIWWWQSSCRLEASWPTTWEPTTWCPPPTSGSSWTVEVSARHKVRDSRSNFVVLKQHIWLCTFFFYFGAWAVILFQKRACKSPITFSDF